MRDDLVDIRCNVFAESKKAWGILDGSRKVWLPKSKVEVEFVDEKHSIVTLPEWLARQERLI